MGVFVLVIMINIISSQVPHQQKNVDLPMVMAILQNAFVNNVHHAQPDQLNMYSQKYVTTSTVSGVTMACVNNVDIISICITGRA